MELSNEEKAKILSLYLGAYIVSVDEIGSDFNDVELTGVNKRDASIAFIDYTDNNTHYADVCMDGYRLLLKPLNRMSEDDAIDFVSEFYWRDKKAIYKVEVLEEGLRFSYPSVSSCYKPFNELFATQHQFLIDRDYAVPLWPWNKTAIELGIAIDATKYRNNLK